jgi:hypothetical protein
MLAKVPDLSLLLPGMYLAAALLVGAAVLAILRRWRRDDPADAPAAGTQLAHYRTLYEQGQISEEEYRRLRTILGVEIRQSVDLPPRPPAPPASSQAVQPARGRENASDSAPPSGDGVRPA